MKTLHHSIRAAVITVAGITALVTAAVAHAAGSGAKRPTVVEVKLSEWSIGLSPARVPAGPVSFHITNGGSIPHAFEVEGHGIEREIAPIPRGGSDSLALALQPATYEVYCPIGNGSHKMLGMRTSLLVTGPAHKAAPAAVSDDDRDMHDMHDMHEAHGAAPLPHAMKVVGGGPVIQILPGPFPFADSAMAVIHGRPADQREDLTAKARMGPYSNQVARIDGTISIAAFDRGASGDSVAGNAAFTTQDGARWRLDIDRVQTQDIPDNPRFGGVIMGLYYHGASNVHTPLVPTIQSSVALWAFAHLYRNDRLVTDNAMVHIMLLSRTRRPGDFALACWDCSRNPIDELQLQVTAAKSEPKFEAPGGFLFVNWEQSSAQPLAGY
jgi:hypothetical protein